MSDLRIKPGFDSIELGRYVRKDSGGSRKAAVELPIVWRILEKKESKLLLLSEYCVDMNLFGEGEIDWEIPDIPVDDVLYMKRKVIWETSLIRSWLNEEFFDKAFSEEEKKLICLTENLNDGNPITHAGQGEPTQDRVFLLSLDEAKDYLTVSSAKTEMIYADTLSAADTVTIWKDSCMWWLRTTGKDTSMVCYGTEEGYLSMYGWDVTADELGIRPAMWINIQL